MRRKGSSSSGAVDHLLHVYRERDEFRTIVGEQFTKSLVKEVIDRIQDDGRIASLAVEMYFILLSHEKDLNSLQYNNLATALQDWKLTMDQKMR